MRIGVYGGTFNPVHNGHIKLAKTYASVLKLDRLLVIPACAPPHKTEDALVSGAHRLAMCRLAFAGVPLCEVSDIEVLRGSKSYTADTLETLHASFPQDEIYLLTGSDIFLTLTTWRRWEQITKLAVLCAGAREASQRESLEQYCARLEVMGAHCRIVELSPLPISSTCVRGWIGEGKDPRGLVPDTVAGYMEEHGLYLRKSIL